MTKRFPPPNVLWLLVDTTGEIAFSPVFRTRAIAEQYLAAKRKSVGERAYVYKGIKPVQYKVAR